jgi:hypothetical protein
MWVGGFQNKIGVRIFLDHTVSTNPVPLEKHSLNGTLLVNAFSNKHSKTSVGYHVNIL